MTEFSRRRFLQIMGISTLAAGGPLSACSPLSSNGSQPKSSAHWDKEVAAIRARIQAPGFPEQNFAITDFGAVADNQTDCTQAIADAIEACAKAGGGRVVVPAGDYKTGPVHLKSNINLHIAEGATLHFIPEPERYKPYVFTRWEGMELMGYSPLIYAYRQTNVAVTGKGTLAGGGDEHHWWPWKGKWKRSTWPDDPETHQNNTRDPLQKMVADGVPVTERVFDNNLLRPPFIQPYECENVLIEGVTITDAPFWLVNPVLCRNVTVTGVHCQSYGPNSDGCDPESCTDVLIENCIFDTGDDCIAIKSGRNNDGRRVGQPCENIIIDNCQMKAGHGGVVIGSEISGGARNLYAQNCEMSSPELDRGIRIKTNSIRGGVLENLNYRNINIGQVKNAIVINFYYEEGDAGPHIPQLHDINIHNLMVEKAQRAFVMRGYPHAPITGVSLNNLQFKQVEKDSQIENIHNIQQRDIFVNGEAFTFASEG